MAKRKTNPPSKYQPWIDAQKRFHLTHEQIQMARELGMNPKKFGDAANHKQESWKTPLPVFIEELYFKRFGKIRPDNVRSIKQMVHDKKQKKADQKSLKDAKDGLNKPIQSIQTEPQTPFSECLIDGVNLPAIKDTFINSNSNVR